MSKLYFLKEGCLLCLQFIALLLKDITKVKLLLVIISLNENMSRMMVFCTEIPGGGKVVGRVVVAPWFLTLYSLPHLETTDPTISHVKQARVLHTSTADPVDAPALCVPHSCSCSMAISTLPRVHPPHKRLCLACVGLPCSAVMCCCSVRAVFHQ